LPFLSTVCAPAPAQSAQVATTRAQRIQFIAPINRSLEEKTRPGISEEPYTIPGTSISIALARPVCLSWQRILAQFTV